MSVSRIQELRRERKELWEEQRQLIHTVNEREDKRWTDEEKSEYDKRMARFDELSEEIQRLEKLEEQRQRMERSSGVIADQDVAPEDRSEAISVMDASMRFLQHGASALTREEVRHFGLQRQDGGPAITVNLQEIRQEMRAQAAGTATAGQEFVPEGFWPSLTEAMLDFGGMRQAATVISTPTGNDMPFPEFDDTSNTGALLAENTQDSEQDVTTAETVLGAYKYTSKIIRVSKELEQDSFFAIGAWLGNVLGMRLGRINNTHATTGTGTAQPNGAVTAASAGQTAAANNAVSRADILGLIHSVDPAYRRGNQVYLMFNDATLEAVRNLEDANNLPLYQVSTRVGAPDTIEGHRFIVNQDIADIGTTAISMLFGDFSYYIMRDVLGITLVRMVERYADFHQIGYVAISRFDADLVDAGGGAIKRLTHPV